MPHPDDLSFDETGFNHTCPVCGECCDCDAGQVSDEDCEHECEQGNDEFDDGGES